MLYKHPVFILIVFTFIIGKPNNQLIMFTGRFLLVIYFIA